MQHCLGLCAGEAGGLTGRPRHASVEGHKSTPGLTTMPRLLPVSDGSIQDEVFETHMSIVLDGIAALARKAKSAGFRVAETFTWFAEKD